MVKAVTTKEGNLAWHHGILANIHGPLERSWLVKVQHTLYEGNAHSARIQGLSSPYSIVDRKVQLIQILYSPTDSEYSLG